MKIYKMMKKAESRRNNVASWRLERWLGQRLGPRLGRRRSIMGRGGGRWPSNAGAGLYKEDAWSIYREAFNLSIRSSDSKL